MRIKSAKDLIVYLDVGGLPAGAVGTFNPNPATGSSTLTVTVSSGVSREHTLTVTGTGGTPAIQHMTMATVVKSQQKYKVRPGS